MHGIKVEISNCCLAIEKNLLDLFIPVPIHNPKSETDLIKGSEYFSTISYTTILS